MDSRMNADRRRPWLLLSLALLFAAWIGYLAHLAATTTRPIVLSRPQFLVAQLDVVADIKANDDGGPEPRVVVRSVLYPVDGPAPVPPGVQFDVTNLAHLSHHEGWQGPGEYILPLVKDAEGKYRLAPIPRSPGFPGDAPRIYRITPETLAQHRQIRGLAGEEAGFAQV